MTDASAVLAALLADARDADPAVRIDWRDRLAAHGAAAIEAVSPWLKEPTLAAFAIRVIARAGLDGEREAAQAALRQARRRLDPRLRADLEWALGVLRLERPAAPAPVRRTAGTPARTEALYSGGTRPVSRRPRSSSAPAS
ncbi:MAG: hypothetical protein QOJ75_400 [Chloroflexota bacterium]|jgi:hypothetical protein|nr:hypothetical protein [Chloroflexota bacterium]